MKKIIFLLFVISFSFYSCPNDQDEIEKLKILELFPQKDEVKEFRFDEFWISYRFRYTDEYLAWFYDHSQPSYESMYEQYTQVMAEEGTLLPQEMARSKKIEISRVKEKENLFNIKLKEVHFGYYLGEVELKELDLVKLNDHFSFAVLGEIDAFFSRDGTTSDINNSIYYLTNVSLDLNRSYIKRVGDQLDFIITMDFGITESEFEGYFYGFSNSFSGYFQDRPEFLIPRSVYATAGNYQYETTDINNENIKKGLINLKPRQ